MLQGKWKCIGEGHSARTSCRSGATLLCALCVNRHLTHPRSPALAQPPISFRDPLPSRRALHRTNDLRIQIATL